VWSVSLFQPPYRVETSALAVPQYGSIAIARLGVAVDVLKPLHELLESYPWCAPCVVVTPGSVSPETLQAIWGLPGQPGFVVASRGFEHLSPADIAKAVANRLEPTTPLLVSYVVRRTQSVALGQTLQQIWSPRPVGPLSAERTLRYRLRRMGSFGRLDWVRVLKLIRAKTGSSGVTVERLASMAGTEPRTLRSWTERCLGTSLRVYRETIGWEWILEAALDRAGLVEGRAALGVAS
jgi:hypothetical protein